MRLKKLLINFIIENFIDSAYCIGYRITNRDFWDENISRFMVLKPTLRYWYADPIPYRINNNIYVFMEKYDRFKKIGYIGVSILRADGRLSKPKTIIKEKSHLSFPMIVNVEGENNYYMIPEVSATKSIVIYKMFGDPYNWEKYHTIYLNQKIVDIAYLTEDDKILLLAGDKDRNNPLYTKRQIIILENLNNREKIRYRKGYRDLKSSLSVRNGGSFICKDSELFRVVQESTTKNYGIFLKLYKINKISESCIEEECVKKKDVNNIETNLSPMFYRKIGIHTYGRCGSEFEVVDVSITKLSILPVLRKLGILKK